MNKEGQRNRVDDSEINLRVMYIAKLIINGYSKRQFLLQKISDDVDSWGLCERQIDNYIKTAKELIRNKFTDDDLSLELDVAASRLEALFTMNMKIQDYREARTVTMDRMKLLGLVSDKVDHKSSDGTMTPKGVILSKEEIKEIDSKLEEGC